MMNEGFLAPTRNLTNPDPRCAPLNYLRGDAVDAPNLKVVMNNNFAFGGINTSLLFRRV
jgi:3-oxoacyl-[acyl-carrier-protein] synthase II